MAHPTPAFLYMCLLFLHSPLPQAGQLHQSSFGNNGLVWAVGWEDKLLPGLAKAMSAVAVSGGIANNFGEKAKYLLDFEG